MEYSQVIQYFYPNFSPALFLRMEQELEDDRLPSVDDVAQAIDAVTGWDFCNMTVAKDGYHPPLDKSTAEQRIAFRDFFLEKLSDPLVRLKFSERLGVDQQCIAAEGGVITIPIKVFWANLEIAAGYSLASTSDVEFSDPVFVNETVEREFTVSEDTGKSIDYYIDIKDNRTVVDQIEFDWIDPVVDKNKNIVPGPPLISVQNNNVIWGKQVSGTFVLKFNTLYHSVQAKINPIDGDYSAKVYAVYKKLKSSLDLVTPETSCPFETFGLNREVECFWLTRHELRQPCGSNEVIEVWFTYDPAGCPADIDGKTKTLNAGLSAVKEIKSDYYYIVGERTIPEYISTSDPRFSHDCSVCTKDGFPEVCCREPESSEPIPPCLEIKSIFHGGVEIEKGRKYWEKKYPGGVTFQEKLPNKGYCGDKSIVFKHDDCKDPCEDVPKLVWDAGNPNIIAPNGSVYLEITGGNYPELPITWEIIAGGGYNFAGGGQTITTGLLVTLEADAEPCGPVEITATDGCSEVLGEVEPTNALTLRDSNPGAVQDDTFPYFYFDYGSRPVEAKITGISADLVWFYGTENKQTSTTIGSRIRIRTAYGVCANTPFVLTINDGCSSSFQQVTLLANAALTLRDSNPGAVPDGTSRYFYFDYGYLPVTATITGDSSATFYGTASRTIVTNSTRVRITAQLGDIGNSFVLTVNDGCNTSSQEVYTID